MIMEKIGFAPHMGRTTASITKVSKLLQEGKKVLYITSHLTGNEVFERMYKIDKTTPFDNLTICPMCLDKSKLIRVEMVDVDTVIVADTSFDVSDIVPNHQLYIYYQERAK